MKIFRMSSVLLSVKVLIVLLGCSTLIGCASYLVGANDSRSASDAKSPSISLPAPVPAVPAAPPKKPSVRVCTSSAQGDPCEPTANIYSDSSLTVPKTSTDPDADGNFSFYAKPGMYELQVTNGDSPTQLVPVAVPPMTGIPTPSIVTIPHGTSFNSNFVLTVSGNLVVTGTIMGQQGVTVGGPPAVGTSPSIPSVGSVTLFSGAGGQLYEENSSGQTLALATSAPTGSPMQYVSFSGNDSNDGLSWGSAKKTVMAGYDALPAAGGVIYIMQGANSASGVVATSTQGQGIWIMGTQDPNYSNPPPGWRRQKANVAFEGVGGTDHAGNSHLGGQVTIFGGGISNNQPCIWLAGGTNYLFENINCVGGGRGIVIGESSTNLRDGTVNVTGTTFTNVAAGVGGGVTNGPVVDVTGGSFWLYFRDCVFSASAAVQVLSPLDSLHAAMLIDGTGNEGNGLIFIEDLITNNGGIKFIPGSNAGSLTVNGMTEEGGFGAPAIYLTSTSSFTMFNFENIVVSDSGVSAPVAIQIDGQGPAQAVLIEGNIGSAGSVIGPATILGQYTNDLINTPTSPAQMGQVGIFNGHIVGETDAARRNFGPVSIRYPNLAPQVATNWTATQFAGTTIITTSIAAPDGTNNAARAASSSASPQENLYFYNGLFPSNTGDYFIGGAWIRSLSAVGGYSGSPTTAISFDLLNPVTNIDYALSGSTSGALSSGQNEWTWQYFIYKFVAATPTNPPQLRFQAHFDLNDPVEAYAPVMMHIPAGEVSDNEAYQIASNLSTYADGLPGGTVATLRGQTFAFGGTGNFFGLLSQSNTANRTYIFPDASGPVALTDISQNWVATQTFDSVNIINSTIDGEAMSHAPIGIFPAFLPGALTTFYTAATFTPEHGVLVTGVEISAKTAPQSCAANAVIQVSGSNLAQVTLTSSQSDSGPLSVLMAGGTPIQIILVPAQTCSVVPQDLNVTVRYRMQ
jgi:hypothetical protein